MHRGSDNNCVSQNFLEETFGGKKAEHKLRWARGESGHFFLTSPMLKRQSFS